MVRIQTEQDLPNPDPEIPTDNPVDDVDDRRKNRCAVRSVAVVKDNSSSRTDRRRMTRSENHSERDRHCSTTADRRRKPQDKRRMNDRSESSHPRSGHRTRLRHDHSGSRDDGPPSDDDGDDSGDPDPGRRSGRAERRNSRRRRHDPSPSDDSDDYDSSCDRDHLNHRRKSAKDFRIKLQKLDGTGSCES